MNKKTIIIGLVAAGAIAAWYFLIKKPSEAGTASLKPTASATEATSVKYPDIADLVAFNDGDTVNVAGNQFKKIGDAWQLVK